MTRLQAIVLDVILIVLGVGAFLLAACIAVTDNPLLAGIVILAGMASIIASDNLKNHDTHG